VGFAAIFLYLKNHLVAYKAGGITLVTLGAMAAINFVLTPRAPVAWRHDQEIAIAEARAAGKPALIDFSPRGCLRCNCSETAILSDRGVRAEGGDRYVRVKSDAPEDNGADQAHKQPWKAPTLPPVTLIAADGKEARRFTGELPSTDEFLSA